jgi:hypothetical protein
MTEAIEISHPPEALLRIFNPALRLALNSPLGASLKEFMVVSFTGRKSGKRFAVPVSAHHLDGDLYVVLEAGWKHNFTDGHPAEVRYKGKTTAMQGQLIKDPATAADIAHRIATAEGAKLAQRSMGMKFRDGAVPSLEEFTESAKRLGIAAIKLTPAAPA